MVHPTRERAQVALSDRIRRAREGLLLNQKDFAAAVGVSPRAVSYWEKGERKPEYEQLRKLVEVTGKSSAYFVEEEEAIA